MTKEEAEEWLPIVHWLNGEAGNVGVHEYIVERTYRVDTYTDTVKDVKYWVGSTGDLYYKYESLDMTLPQLKALYSLATGNNERKTT